MAVSFWNRLGVPLPSSPQCRLQITKSETSVGVLGGGYHRHGNAIFGQCRNAVSLGSVAVGSGYGDSGFVVPVGKVCNQPLFPLVKAVIVGGGNEVKAQVKHGVAHLGGG
ncbi:MAG: hypothetical protein RR276_04325, partial [Angelakisella sp.]